VDIELFLLVQKKDVPDNIRSRPKYVGDGKIKWYTWFDVYYDGYL